MNKQIHIYSVDTSFFYNENEVKIHRKLNKNYKFRSVLKGKINKYKKEDEYKQKLYKHMTSTNQRIRKHKDELYNEFTKNNEVRTLNDHDLSNKNIIAVFDSALTRTLELEENKLSNDIIVVQTYFFNILEDIILNGFLWNNEKYVCFTASAGQIRTKKTVFIKEELLIKHQNTITCGLPVEKINQQGGMNINKYLAYMALCNTASDEWKEFNIKKTIVVDDMETTVRSLVDFIDDETYEITRKEMDIEINHTDGAGMILPSLNKKSFMCRLPFIKGLLIPFPFDKFIREAIRKNPKQKYGIVTDIYGKQHDILNDEISVIFTKSQFKLWKYYSSWNEYQENFTKFNCQACKTNEEEDIFNNAKLNYQMLQSLTDMTNEELEKVSKNTKNDIYNVGRDRKTMLKLLGVVDSNDKKNYIQQALDIYPELLSDTYSKEILKQVKKSLVKEGRAGKLDIDGKYTFICPDLYSFCEYLILGDKKPKGLLRDGEVYCKLYENEEKLDCLRSPHLYREHAVRRNIIDKEKKRWFITNGVYTSIHDTISKILMFDVDGDKSLICADHTIIEVAERNMEGIVPLFYNMRKAEAEEINNHSIYKGLKTAYTGGNIGMISNDITKIWNSDNVNLDVIKWLCMENNFVIDFAKTLYKPTRPKDMHKLITSYTKLKTPHFFIYAKDKTDDKVELKNDSVVNRLEKIVPNPIINFRRAKLGSFDYKMLMSNKDVKLDNDIINKYTELDIRKKFMTSNKDDETNNISFMYRDIKEQLLSINDDIEYVTDVLIEYLYIHKKSNFKTTLWECFGDVIVANLKQNVENVLGDNSTVCEVCSVRIENYSTKRYCESCAKEIKKKQNRIADRKYKIKIKKRREK